MTSKIKLESTITCPNCGHKTTEKMEVDSCRFFYICPHCSYRMKPKEGDCCVFCSFGDVPCPPMQKK